MNTYKIKYQRGSNIMITTIEANNKKEALYLFYMNHSQDDVLDIVEV